MVMTEEFLVQGKKHHINYVKEKSKDILIAMKPNL